MLSMGTVRGEVLEVASDTGEASRTSRSTQSRVRALGTASPGLAAMLGGRPLWGGHELHLLQRTCHIAQHKQCQLP
jgi:hypothetical protein